MDNRLTSSPASGEIGFRQLFAEAWTARWALLGITIVFTVAGILIGLSIPAQYRAEILITPTDSPAGSGGGLGSLASQYGALASLAGLSLGGKSTKAEAIAVLQSELITEAYVHENNLLPVLFFDRWDQASGTWKSSDRQKI